MRCPTCASLENKVIDSRMNQVGDLTRRRRHCMTCDGRFTTYERVETLMPMVIKKDDRREAFDREKIFHGVQKACQKRPITTAQVDKITNEIEHKVSEYSQKEISSHIIGLYVMTALRKLDSVAYVRFASVYREFKDVDEFVANIREGAQALDESL